MVDGYIYNSIPQSKKEALSINPLSRAVLITKSAIQKRIEDFFDSKGRYRKLLETQAPIVKQYITDQTFEKDYRDTSKRHMLLAKYFNDIKQSLPTILIVETAVEYIPSGLGEWADSHRIDAHTFTVTLHLMLKVTIDLVIGAQDSDTHALLANSLCLIFGPMRNIVGSALLPSHPSQRWEVLLPIKPIIPPSAGVNIGEDAANQIWTGNVTLEEVKFEGFSTMEYDVGLHQPNCFPAGSWDGYPDADASSTPVINIPTTMRLGDAVRMTVIGKPVGSKLFIDRPDIATFSSETLIVRPRRVGSFTIYLVAAGYTPGDSSKILATAAVTVPY